MVGVNISIVLQVQTNYKNFWKCVKLLNESIATLQQGDCIASSDKEKADMLNAFFWNSSKLPLTEEAFGNQSPYEDATITPDLINKS